MHGAPLVYFMIHNIKTNDLTTGMPTYNNKKSGNKVFLDGLEIFTGFVTAEIIQENV